jgi:fructose-1,6-bisphosphatase/inositol monophosphatase family enzyme
MADSRLDLLRFAGDMRLALYQCGQIAQALQGKVAREDKAPDSVHQTSTEVSVVDRLCQEMLLLKAYEAAPHLEMQSEELADCPPAILELYARNRSPYVLVLDPVDGTGEYLQGKRGYAHMLGLLNQETGRMDCGMIYFPALARLYMGLRGMGAFVADGLWATPRPMTIAQPTRTVEDVKRLLSSDYQTFQRLGFALVPPESASAAYELTRVAEGRLGAMVMRHFHGHDTAISSVIIEELGGLVLTGDGRPVTYERDMPRMPLVISSLAPELARELCSTLGAA